MSVRKNKVIIERDHIAVTQQPGNKNEYLKETINEVSERIQKTRSKNASVMLTFGAHTIKTGWDLH